MCDLCKKSACPPRCPNYGGGRGIRCMSCGARLGDGEPYYLTNGKPYCAECVEAADLEELVRICETETEELYFRMGLVWGAYDSAREVYGD